MERRSHSPGPKHSRTPAQAITNSSIGVLSPRFFCPLAKKWSGEGRKWKVELKRAGSGLLDIGVKAMDAPRSTSHYLLSRACEGDLRLRKTGRLPEGLRLRGWGLRHDRSVSPRLRLPGRSTHRPLPTLDFAGPFTAIAAYRLKQPQRETKTSTQPKVYFAPKSS
jgi:hypothetical protein